MADKTIGINAGAAQFLWDSYRKDCDWTSLVRELVENEFDAGATSILIGKLPPQRVLHSDARAPKLFIYGNGHGFDPAVMATQLIDLFTTGREQGHDKNFGIGAKLVLYGLSPHGADYWTRNAEWPDTVFRARLALVDGTPTLVDLVGDGSCIEARPAAEAPGPLAESPHGTVVIVHGTGPDHDTTEVPDGLVGGKRWVSRALNHRYYRFPDGVQVKTSVETDVFGKQTPLPARSVCDIMDLHTPRPYHGSVDIAVPAHPGGALRATVHWYLVREGAKVPDSHGREQHGETFALLYDDECYAGRYGAQARGVLDAFGIRFASKRVSLFVALDDQWLPNKPRTGLERGGHGPDLVAIGAQFAARLPDEIVKAEQDSRRRTLQHGGKGKWRDKLAAMLDVLRMPTYRLDTRSRNVTDADQAGTVDRPGSGPDREHSQVAEQPAPASQANRHGTRTGTDGGHVTRPRGFTMPTVRFVEAAEMDDASHVAEWNPLTRVISVNNAHAEVHAALDHWRSKVIADAEAHEALVDEVREVWRAQLIERVIVTERLTPIDSDAYATLLGAVICERLLPDAVLRQATRPKHRLATW